MKTLSPSLWAHLQSGATTLCWCWRITTRAGERLGFTDHDRDLVFDATTFEAATGFTATEIRDQVGLAVPNLDVESALVSDRLSETRLAAGDFDDAAVEIYRVNWASPGDRVLMRSGSLGEVRRTGAAFSAEVRGLAHYLQQAKGRVFQYVCDADLGDRRCGISLSAAAWRATGTVQAARDRHQFTATTLGTFSSGWFTRGLLTFTSGANAGRSSEVKRHAVTGASVFFDLWRPMIDPVLAGDAFTVTAGCDKQHATCRDKFANVVRYQGFPHMPGNDALAAGPGSTIGQSPIAP